MIKNIPQSLLDAVKKVLSESNSTQESNKIYYRGTDNPDEQELVTSGKLNPSINHETGKPEVGVSVSDVSSVGKYFKFLYKVSGKELQHLGSDGEPLLDPKSMKFIEWVKSPRLNESVEHPMIDVDGVQKHRHNSLGQPIHHTEEGIKNFHRWFGDSKAVDKHGRPLVVYHGTANKFDEFDKSKIGSTYDVDDHGFYFTSLHHEADKWADSAERLGIKNKTSKYGDSRVIPAYVNLHHPWTIHVDTSKETGMSPVAHFESGKGQFNRGQQNTVQYAVDSGYDGMILRDHKIDSDHEAMVVPFHPHQIKSIDNTGAFSHPTKITESDDYREQHTSPGPETGSPAHDLTKGAYPEDFYSSKGHQYYGDGRSDDKIVHSHLKSLRNRPEADVKIYRAVPNKDEIKDINPGDWVTTNLEYAKDHGESQFDNHKILTKNVKAKELFTDGSSFHEFGYHPAKQQHTMTDSVRQAYSNMVNE